MRAVPTLFLSTVAAAVGVYAWPKGRKFVESLSTEQQVASGLGVSALFVGLLHLALDADKAPAPSAPEQVLPNVEPLPHPSEPVHLAGKTLQLDTGATYAGAISLSWPLSSLANAERVKAYAESMGFRDVVVFEGGTPGWPGPLPDADYFVFGMWSAAPKTMDRPSQLVDAWRA